jgi:alpha-galactosidase
METGHPEHLYYGRKIALQEEASLEPLVEKHAFAPGNTIAYNQENTHFSLEDVCLEMSSYGKGDIREPFIEVIHKDGSYTSDFLFEKAEITRGKEAFETLPGSYCENGQVITFVSLLQIKLII